LEDALNVNRHIVDRLQGRNEDEEKGAIVKVKGGLSIISPPERQSRHQSRSRQDEDEDEESWQPRPHKGRREQDEDEDEKHSRPHHKGGSRRQHDDNGLEETICSARLHQNIGSSSSPDIYNPQAGRIKTITSLDLPVLRWIKLSAEHGTLHKVCHSSLFFLLIHRPFCALENNS
jgi:hypothetical protein